MYEKSLETVQKQLSIFVKPRMPDETREKLLPYILSGCISAFDGLGKELRRRYPTSFPEKPKNLFQNLIALDESMDGYISKHHSDYSFLNKMFQVRHIYEHNMCVVDNDFIIKISGSIHMLGKKYVLNEAELTKFIDFMEELGGKVKDYIKRYNLD